MSDDDGGNVVDVDAFLDNVVVVPLLIEGTTAIVPLGFNVVVVPIPTDGSISQRFTDVAMWNQHT